MQEEYNDKPGDSRAEEQVPAPDQPVKANIGKRNFLNLHFLIDLIFLAGLVVLYILFFSSKKNSEPSFPNAFQKSSGAHSRVVFVNIDSLNNQYTFIIKLKTDLEATGRRYESEIQSQQAALEKEAANFQKQMDARAIPEDKAKLMYESLMQKQQALAEKKERYTQQVNEKQLAMNQVLLDTVTNFLKRYNRTYGFDYILGYKMAGEILLANDTLDITPDVVKALNKEYKEKGK